MITDNYNQDQVVCVCGGGELKESFSLVDWARAIIVYTSLLWLLWTGGILLGEALNHIPDM